MEDQYRTNPWRTPPVWVDPFLVKNVISQVQTLHYDDPHITDVEIVSRTEPLIRNVIVRRIDQSRMQLSSIHRLVSRDDNELVALSDCAKLIQLTSSLKANSEIDNSIFINASDPLLGPIYTSATELHESVYRRRVQRSRPNSDEDYKDFLPNYYQIVLDNSINADYVVAFLTSHHGREILNSARLPIGDETVTLNQDGPAPVVRKNLKVVLKSWMLGSEEVSRIPILRPAIEQQRIYVSLDQKVRSLHQRLVDFQTILPMDLSRMESLERQIDSLFSNLGTPTDQEQIRRWSQQDESLTLEFKESYRVSGKNKSVDKGVQISALKEIVGMINSRGGTLLIGIHDKARVPTELFQFEINTVSKNRDAFLNQFGADIERQIGKDWVSFYEARIVEYMEKPVLVVTIEPHPPGEFAYLDKEPYVRQSEARTIKMSAQEWHAYTRRSAPLAE